MLTGEMKEILKASRSIGWVMEPEAKRIFSLAGLDVPRFRWAKDEKEVVQFGEEIGYPLVAKIVSPKIIHKSDSKGVAVGIKNQKELMEVHLRFCQAEAFAGMLIEEKVEGVEVIVGAKTDYQFGPIILLGMGGTSAEIYRDVSLRMAPLNPIDAASMVKCLRAHELLEGYRGSDPVDLAKLTEILQTFSQLVMDLQDDIESIDLNPVMCSSTRCVVADARIMLRR
jgi:acetate---CoA ligase (ADP-forming) subunit beta